MTEVSETFACFGSTCTVFVMGDGRAGTAEEAVASARRRLLSWHDRFTRFEPSSELSRLNSDPRTEVPVSSAMALFVDAAVRAAEATGGLVDATLLGQIERAGYLSDLRTSLPLEVALRIAPGRRPARPHPDATWRGVRVDRRARTVTRPPGVMLDSGGLAKGLFADLLAQDLATHASFALDCAGDLRIGGACNLSREIHVASPFGEGTLRTFESAATGVATSGIGKRSWLDGDGRPAHHLLDPATGRPAFTGLVQVTALAPSALEAERRAKAAILSGPVAGRRWLPHGGVLVHDDGSHEAIRPRDRYLGVMTSDVESA
jgi:thiamine biosynthesis lipoprotein